MLIAIALVVLIALGVGVVAALSTRRPTAADADKKDIQGLVGDTNEWSIPPVSGNGL
ncbi:hypothetical protein [Luteipulveratus mongoliensis]|uniref:hypothetical protein n=1 Tax=Luteipulveratus mongoliensis TaxID=571913 RepID=UPI0012ED660A|nr:hypothetical protein [Luteipulveratus mongoliensis]